MASFPADSVLFSGRTAQESGVVKFDNPGVSFSFIVNGADSVSALLSQAVDATYGSPNYFSVFVDGELRPNANSSLPFSFSTENWESDTIYPVTLVDGLDSSSHRIDVFKCSEAQWNGKTVAPNYVSLHGLDCTGDRDIDVTKSTPPQRRIEFIGDSITAGYCNLCEQFPAVKNAAAESHFDSWPAAVARIVSAEFHSVAWSGYGIVNNCCGGSTHMPAVYSRALSSDSGSVWSLSDWIPDAVVINLGTNDVGSGAYDEAAFVSAYTKLCLDIVGGYGPSTALFLACGPMTDKYCGGVRGTVEAVAAAAASSGMSLVVQMLDQTRLGIANSCCGHPSASEDAILAMHAAEQIMQSLGWE